MRNHKKLELLAPAGNLEKLKTALRFGADAVYAGIPDFSLRVRINDFDLGTLAAAAYYCHQQGKKIYVTVNIFAHNRHLEALPPYLRKLKEIKVDALIVSDPGVMAMVKEIWPEAVIHLSTQANCTNWQAARFWQQAGASRIILGREVTLAEIKEIKKNNPSLELEYFVHGAMCMAYSGRCFLSKEILNRSGNLGDCAQPCRWEWKQGGRIGQKMKMDFQAQDKEIAEFPADPDVKDCRTQFISTDNHPDEFEIVEEEHGAYLLNSKDLCLVKHIKDLAEAGVSCFKIEGRAKSIYYQAVVCAIYSRVIQDLDRLSPQDLDYYHKELEEKLVHRGYTTGFLLGQKAGQNAGNSHFGSDWEFCGEALANDLPGSSPFKGENQHYTLLKIHNSLKVGDRIEIVQPGYDIIRMKVEKILDYPAQAPIAEVHGGQGKQAFVQTGKRVEVGSIFRRKSVQ